MGVKGVNRPTPEDWIFETAQVVRDFGGEVKTDKQIEAVKRIAHLIDEYTPRDGCRTCHRNWDECEC